MLLALGLGVLIGLVIGALGGGGSILTVPALVFVVGLSAQAATTLMSTPIRVSVFGWMPSATLRRMIAPVLGSTQKVRVLA